MLKKYFTNRKINIIRIAILLLAIISILVLDVKTIKYVREKDIESYHVQNYSSAVQSVQQGELETQFKAVSEKLLYLELWCEGAGSTQGTITYQILDGSGINVLSEKNVNFSDVLDIESQKIQLDISEVEYNPGQNYYLKALFDINEPVGIILDANGIELTQIYRVTYQKLLYAAIVIINALAVIFLLAFWKWGWNDRLFLIMSLTVGVLAVALTPPFSREDEARHFARAYDLSCGGNMGYQDVPAADSTGHIMVNGEGKAYLIKIPRELAELRQVAYFDNYVQRSYFAELNQSLCLAKLTSIFAQPEEDGMIEVSEEATLGRRWESYWPQIIMIWLGRTFGVRSGLWYYMAKFGQVLFSSLILWIAMKLMKNHRHLVWFCSFIAPVLLLRASCNPDGIMMAEMILCISAIIHLRENKCNLLEKKSLALLAVYFVLLYMIYKMKAPYAIFCLGFLLLLKKDNFAFLPWDFIKKHKYKIAGIIIGVCVLGIGYLAGIRRGDILLAMVHQFVPQEHIDYILANPGVFGHLYLNKFWQLLLETKTSLRGSYYISYNWIFLIGMVFTCRRFSILNKCYQAFLFLLLVGMIVLAGYTLTPPDYGQIWGITYRYILPAVPALGFIFPLGTEKTECYAEQIYPMVFIAAVTASCLLWVRM